jgi:hypothetical protein
MDPEQDLYSFYDDEPIEPIGVFANESEDDEEVFAQAAFSQPGPAFSQPGPAFSQPGPAFSQPGPAFVQADFDSISPAVKRIETSRMAQANRDAASDEQRAVATQLRAAPLPSPHTSHKSKGNASCMECANTLNKLYIQNGSTIDFAMIDYRWPVNICRHLKPEARCILCYGISMCKHNRDKFRCVKCMGAAYCRDPTHRNRGKNGAALRKTACKDCIAEKSLIGSIFVSEKGNGAEAQGGAKRLIKRKHSTKRRRSVKKKRFTKRNNK